MNYIAHIHIGFHTQTNLLGNFLGDFVKGNQLQSLAPELALGVKLHRKVDVFTDNHELIKKLRQGFPPSLRRVSGIVIDVVFDHLLLCHWQHFGSYSEQQVFELFYQQLEAFKGSHSTHLSRLKTSLLKDRWLVHYRDPTTCLRALLSIEQRLGHKITFAQAAYQFFQQRHAIFEACFVTFYPELLQHALHCTRQLTAEIK